MELRKKAIYDLLGTKVHVIVDRPIGYLHGDIVYSVHYGYVPGLMGGDGEEQDAYILGVDTPVQEFDGVVIGAILRMNDVEDKLIVAPSGMEFHQAEIAEMVHFQEQYFTTRVISALEKSCGVLAYRIVDGIREFLLVFESYSKCWSLPKGHMEPGETEIQTALRELYEETGLSARLDTSRSAIMEYPISPKARKQVEIFLGEVSGNPKCRDGEIDGCRWVLEKELEQYLFPDTCEACRKLLG